MQQAVGATSAESHAGSQNLNIDARNYSEQGSPAGEQFTLHLHPQVRGTPNARGSSENSDLNCIGEMVQRFVGITFCLAWNEKGLSAVPREPSGPCPLKGRVFPQKSNFVLTLKTSFFKIFDASPSQRQ